MAYPIFPGISHFSKFVFKTFLPLFCITLFSACASIGNPSGGPKDEEPPRFISANPPQGSVNAMPNRAVLQFSELVNVKDPFSNVVISPLSSKIPKVSSQGSKVIVDFQEPLLPNTTYTLDFGNSIEDNNEANKLENFAYSFSTGETIDSLRIGGIVLGAEDLEPRPGLIVGIYTDTGASGALRDSAFMRHKPLRVARTDDRGRFLIRGVAAGNYRIYALGDADADWHYANPEEEIAFLPFSISPSARQISVQDSIRNMTTGNVDSVVSRIRTQFLPNSLILRSFKSSRLQQYLKDYSRIDSTRIKLVFNAAQKQLPSLAIVSPNNLSLKYAVEHSSKNDTIICWLRGHDLVSTDSLRLSVSYNIFNNGKDSLKTDTLNFFTSKPRPIAQKQKNKRINKSSAPETTDSVSPFLPLTFISSSSQDVNNPVVFETATPLVSLDLNAFHLHIKAPGDSVYQPSPLVISPQILRNGNLVQFVIMNPKKQWDFDTDYKITVDSLAATGIYGLSSKPVEFNFKTKSQDDYCSLSLTISGWPDDIPAFVQLLNSSDSPVRTELLSDGKVIFRFLPPGKYFARIVADSNANGIYDAGELTDDLLPDEAFYYPKALNLRKNWDLAETWNPFSTAIDLQKPDQIKKNKPAADKRKKQTRVDPEDDDPDAPFDPNANPFDPNDSKRRKSQRLK